MKRLIQRSIGLFIIPAGLMVSGTAFAQSGECAADADCAEGQVCEKGMFVEPCEGTVDGGEPADCNSEPQVAETGYCFTPPTPCEANSDCEEYLSCVSSSYGECAVDSEGNEYCSEPDPEAPKYCSFAVMPCETDDECPREFECVAYSACPAISCMEGDEECLVECEPSDQKECQPKQIACEETSDCPDAWSCQGNVMEECTGGSVDGGEEPVEPDEVTCTQTPTVGSCYPDAYGLIYSTDVVELNGEAEDGSTTGGPLSGDADGASAGGGCSVARGPGRFDATWALGLLLAVPLLRRRRALA